MKNFKIVDYPEVPGRFIIKTAKDNILAICPERGYKTEQNALKHLYSHIAFLSKTIKMRNFLAIMNPDQKGFGEEELHRIHFRNLINLYWDCADHGRKFKKKLIEKALAKSGYTMKLTIGEFYNRLKKVKEEEYRREHRVKFF